MRTWVFNNNSWDRRGVWHIPDGELKGEFHPAHIDERTATARRYHKNNCKSETVGYDSAKGRYIYAGCTCGLGDDKAFIELGEYTEVLHVPAYTKYEPIEVLCGQVTIRSSDYVDYKRSYKERQPGERVEYQGRISRPTYIFEGDQPPGPVCSRCLKKADG